VSFEEDTPLLYPTLLFNDQEMAPIRLCHFDKCYDPRTICLNWYL